ncbi:hypothetical protein, partial [Porphyromonas gingivalis]|uniref:hypothetical protein n=1 Tax=Porphyromonas gingivalis TaxID=837 RepID=UPI00117E4F5D
RHPRVRPVLIVCPADNLPAGEQGELLQKTLAHFQAKGFDPQPKSSIPEDCETGGRTSQDTLRGDSHKGCSR